MERLARAAGAAPVTSALWSVALAGAMALLLAPAFWNGFPFLYYDSVDYLRQPFTGELPEWRTAAFGCFVWIARIFGTLWAVPVAISAMLLATVVLAMRALVPESGGKSWLAVGAGLFLGGAPFYTSQVMADGLTGAVILGAIALLFGREGLGRWSRVALILLVAISAASHTSHIGILLGLLVLGLFLRAAAIARPALPRPDLGSMALAAVLTLATAVGANWAVAGRPFLTQSTSLQMLALFVENDLAERYLDDVCPGPNPPTLKLCDWRHRMPKTANQFLWDPVPLQLLGGWNDEMHAEAETIVAGALAAFPGAVLAESARFTLRQLVMVAPGDGLRPMQSFMWEPIRNFYPVDEAGFITARQQAKVLDFDDFALPSYGLLAASGVVLLSGFLLLIRQGRLRAAAIVGFVAAAILGNAFICGALSNPNHRYQGRLLGVQVAVAALLLERAARFRRERVRPASSPDGIR